jgi:hypothetical protein
MGHVNSNNNSFHGLCKNQKIERKTGSEILNLTEGVGLTKKMERKTGSETLNLTASVSLTMKMDGVDLGDYILSMFHMMQT